MPWTRDQGKDGNDFVSRTIMSGMLVSGCSVFYGVASFQPYQSLYSIEFRKMFIIYFLSAVVSIVTASPITEGLFGLADISSGFSVNGFSPSAEKTNEIALQVMTDNDEGLTWQEPARNPISTPAIPENSIAYSTTSLVAGAGHKVEKAVQEPVDPGETFRKFNCNDSNGVCCMGNPLAFHRAAQRCEQSIQPCLNPFYNARLMLCTEGNFVDAGIDFLWPMDSRIGHYCNKPEYIDDCSKLLDEQVRTFFLNRKINM